LWQKDRQPTFFSERFANLVPEDDRFRVIKENVDFAFVNEIARSRYSSLGPTGYAPDKLFRMLIVMYLEGIRSERELEKRLTFDIRYRYFCDLDIDDDIPDHSTFCVFRSRLSDELFKEIFVRILDRIFALGFDAPEHVSIDSTSVIADCATPRERGDKPVTDPDAAWGRKKGKQPNFGYGVHLVIDADTGLIVAADVAPANVDDMVVAKDLIPEALDSLDQIPEHLSADSAYAYEPIHEILEEKGVIPIIPTRGAGPKMEPGFSKDDFIFNGVTFICPAGHPMKRYGKKTGDIRFVGTECDTCLMRSSCTKSKTEPRMLRVSGDWQRKLKHKGFTETDKFKEQYKKRSGIERINAELKRWHGLARAKFRGLVKVRIQLFASCIALNLKKLAAFISKSPPKAAYCA